ncbi:hypothetical protein SAMN06893096_103356 [Geodermatophilus pulveris]|uniref:Uncharacterized protein n=1 Tax=Geodermatophilus pulveris TaxID=1564159 RepID=A0A239DV64_9ACTN|nr:hypothetical protein [Geodermatophilus pulveris]SNS35613.1 hypothetical protein SAMN06893096_103356 [Geodermatophilus pulveris]
MSAPPGLPDDPPALVAGELRGFRRFRLAEDGLRPPVHVRAGPWAWPVEHARCAVDPAHAPPARACACGLYGWYHPSHTGLGTGWGDVTAVVAARGRIVLGDAGFRAAAARVEAVSLPLRTALSPRQRRRWEQVLAERYPGAAVHRSRRRMLRAHPPGDLSALGIVVRPSRAPRYRWTALAVWLAGALAVCSVAVVPHRVLVGVPPAGWLAALAGFVLWQALLVWLVCRASPLPAGAEGGPAGQAPR